jgi:leucyl aminopeptidase (aminopeptidase T)
VRVRGQIAALVAAGALAMSEAASAQGIAADWNAVAPVLVRQMQLAQGERVLLVGVAGQADPLIPLVRAGIRAAGGRDLGVVASQGPTPAEWQTDLTRRATRMSRADQARLYAEEVDVAVMLPGATVGHTPYDALQDVLRGGRARTIHFHWSGAFAPDGSPLPLTPAVNALYAQALQRTDYVALADLQRRFERAMRGGEVRVTTPAGTDIRLRIGDRPVTRQDGDASASRARQGRNLIDREVELPAGAIRVAPMEESVSGKIVFPPSSWSGERAEGVTLTFDRGRVVGVEATHGRAAVERELETGGPSARAFRELAVGFNPLLAIPTSGERWIPYYGYGAGVVRLSLGDNTELGGAVGGGYLRWNFFVDATVRVGDEIWVRDGALVKQ